MINWIAEVADLPSMDSENRLLLVVDGGATHSRVAIGTARGDLRGYARGGPTNIRSVGADGAAANLAAVVGDALADGHGGGPVDPGDLSLCLVTSASIDTLEQASVLSDAVRAIAPSATVATVPDTMGCWAATNALGAAVAVISGTGSVVVAADRDRRIWRRFGGWDFVLGDEGSGYALGRAALQEALLVGEDRSGAVALHDAVLAAARERAASSSGTDAERRVAESTDIPDAVHQPFIDKAWIAAFAPVLLALASDGDPASVAIVRREVGVLAAAAVAGVEALAAADPDLSPVPIGLFGGTFNADVLTEAFVAAVEAGTDRLVSAFVPEHSALVGAFGLALGPGPGSAEANDRLAAELRKRYAAS